MHGVWHKMTQKDEKLCFVICPIGEEDKDIREESELVMELIISPAARACGYEAKRSIDLNVPATLTNMIINHLINAPLVIADLTHGNPNVFYELAIRHAVKKPSIQIIREGGPIPSDVNDQNTVIYSTETKKRRNNAINKIVEQIRSVEKNPSENPILAAVTFDSLKKSEDPVEKGYAEIMAQLEEIRKLLILQAGSNGGVEALLEHQRQMNEAAEDED